jgi:hypothetical protein
MKSCLYAVSLSIVFCAIARGELKWERTTLELHPNFGDKEAVGHFKYENVGKTPVRFKSVHSSCGCTAAQSQHEQARPGDKGEITATFQIGDRKGTQVKSVTVETDDPAQKKIVLTLVTVLPQILEVRPAFVYWSPGEAAKSKTIVVRTAKDFPAKDLNVTSSNPGFTIKVNRAKAVGEWIVNVEPKQTERAAAGSLTIQTGSPASPKASAVVKVIGSPQTR